MSIFQKSKFIILILGTYIFAAYSILGVKLSVIVMAVVGFESFLEMLLAIKKRIVSRTTQKILGICIIILLCMMVAAIFNYSSIIDKGSVFRRIVYVLCCVSICISISFQVRRLEDVEFITDAIIIITTISSFFVILQYCGFSWAWIFAGSSEGDLIQGTDQRFYGLSNTILVYAYMCSATIAYILLRGRKQGQSKTVWIFLLTVNVFALALNRTRSALLGVAVIFLFFILRTEIKSLYKFMYILLILIVFAFISFIGFGSSFSESFQFVIRISEAKSFGSTSRLPMILTALNHMLHYPLGMSEYHVQNDLIIGTTSSIERSYVLEYPPHNLFANCGVDYGVVALLSLLVLYKSFIYIFRTNRTRIKKAIMNCTVVSDMSFMSETLAVNAGVYGVIMIEAINALFHNNYILAEDVISWVFIGLLLSLSFISKSTVDNSHVFLNRQGVENNEIN